MSRELLGKRKIKKATFLQWGVVTVVEVIIMVTYIKGIGAMAIVGLFVVAGNIVKDNQYAVGGVVSLATLILIIAALWVLVFLTRHTHTHIAAIRHNQLDVAIKQTQLQHMMEAHQVAMRTQSLMHFQDSHMLVQHTSEGVGILYTPVKQLAPTQVIEVQDEPLLIERPMPSGLSLIKNGLVGMTDNVVLGLDEQRNLVERAYKRVKNILVLGLSGGGKSNTLARLAIQTLLVGGRIALIDKHARAEDESLYGKLKPFEQLFDTPVGDNPIAAMRVVTHVRKVLDSRLNGAEIDYTLLLLIDEFTAIMNKANDKSNQWHDVAVALAGLVEDIEIEGRKVKVRVIAAGQAANASRTGGTEVRDLFNTRIYHNMRERQAGLVGMAEFKKDIKGLSAGQVMVDMEGEEPYSLQVPYLPDEDLEALTKLLMQRAFIPSSEPLQTPETDDTLNPVNEPVEPVHEYSSRVQTLKNEGLSKSEIILEVWGARPGGTAKWRDASREYDAIING